MENYQAFLSLGIFFAFVIYGCWTYANRTITFYKDFGSWKSMARGPEVVWVSIASWAGGVLLFVSLVLRYMEILPSANFFIDCLFGGAFCWGLLAVSVAMLVVYGRYKRRGELEEEFYHEGKWYKT